MTNVSETENYVRLFEIVGASAQKNLIGGSCMICCGRTLLGTTYLCGRCMTNMQDTIPIGEIALYHSMSKGD